MVCGKAVLCKYYIFIFFFLRTVFTEIIIRWQTRIYLWPYHNSLSARYYFACSRLLVDALSTLLRRFLCPLRTNITLEPDDNMPRHVIIITPPVNHRIRIVCVDVSRLLKTIILLVVPLMYHSPVQVKCNVYVRTMPEGLTNYQRIISKPVEA